MGENTVAVAQYTITDFQDIIQQGEEPASPSDGMLWIDTSLDPPQMKRYVNDGWVVVNDPQTLQTYADNAATDAAGKVNGAIDAVKERLDTAETTIETLTDSVSSYTQGKTAFDWVINNVTKTWVDGVEQDIADYKTYMHFDDNGLVIGKTDSKFNTLTDDTHFAIQENGQDKTWLNNETLCAYNVRSLRTIGVGAENTAHYEMTQTSNGGFGLVWRAE